MKLIGTGLALFLVCNILLAQPQLALIKKNHVVSRFGEGEYIRFQKKGSDEFIRALITGIHPGFFMLGGDTIYHYEVAKIDVSRKTVTNFKVSSIGKALIVAGISLMAIDAFNTLVIRENDYKLDAGVGVASAALIGTGCMLQIVNNNYFVVGRKRKLASLHLR